MKKLTTKYYMVVKKGFDDIPARLEKSSDCTQKNHTLLLIKLKQKKLKPKEIVTLLKRKQ